MVPENIHTPPQKGLDIPGGGGGPSKFKAMYEAKLEFPEGWGVIGQISFHGGPSMGGGGRYGYFLEPHIAYYFAVY